MPLLSTELLPTVNAYAGFARALLQDFVPPYRYSDGDMVIAISAGLAAAKLLRPDLFIGQATIPAYDLPLDGTPVPMDTMYRMALVYYMVGYCQLRDEEDTQDARAAGFMNKFTAMLLKVGG
jgi:hypothetical protein